MAVTRRYSLGTHSHSLSCTVELATHPAARWRHFASDPPPHTPAYLVLELCEINSTGSPISCSLIFWVFRARVARGQGAQTARTQPEHSPNTTRTHPQKDKIPPAQEARRQHTLTSDKTDIVQGGVRQPERSRHPSRRPIPRPPLLRWWQPTIAVRPIRIVIRVVRVELHGWTVIALAVACVGLRVWAPLPPIPQMRRDPRHRDVAALVREVDQVTLRHQTLETASLIVAGSEYEILHSSLSRACSPL
jgi:hypothetical protein